jgi:hypothetical protein
MSRVLTGRSERCSDVANWKDEKELDDPKDRVIPAAERGVGNPIAEAHAAACSRKPYHGAQTRKRHVERSGLWPPYGAL